MFAEDDDSMRRFIEIVLHKEGYQIVSVSDGLLAMKAALESDFDAVVADAVMPNMSGFDLCRMLRGNAAKKDIPFIILSGFKREGAASEEDCFADVFLTKDSNIKESLIKTLADIFDGRAT